MTGPTDPNLALYANEDQFTPRNSYLKTITLRDATLARATDANQVQSNTEDALAAFAGDVDLALRSIVRSVTSKILALERRQAAFELSINTAFAAYQVTVNAELDALRQYARDQDALNLISANKYTDDAFAKLRAIVKDATKQVIVLATPELDGGTIFAGQAHDFTIIVIPGGYTLHVHRWAFHYSLTSGSPITQLEEVNVTWPHFLGFRDLAHKQTFDEDSGDRKDTPLFSLSGPMEVTAQIFVHNIGARAVFTVDGYLVPLALEG